VCWGACRWSGTAGPPGYDPGFSVAPAAAGASFMLGVNPVQPLLTLGDLVMDVVARVDGALDPDTDTPAEVRSAPGGSAANFAAWTVRLGGAARFVGRVGADLLGRALLSDLVAEGVQCHVSLDATRPTAVLVLFAEGSRRHMLVPDGANHYLDLPDLPEAAVRSAGWLHLTGYAYFWDGPARVAQRALELAAEAGVPVSLDPSSAGFIRRHGLAVPPRTRLLLPNSDEAVALTGREDVEAAARQLGDSVELVAVKLGATGALLCQRGVVTRVPPALPTGPVIDTTGAGDAWGAAFVHGLRRGREPIAAAHAANRLAAQVVTQLGARPSFAIPVDLL